jgi:hypothetical protein
MTEGNPWPREATNPPVINKYGKSVTQWSQGVECEPSFGRL